MKTLSHIKNVKTLTKSNLELITKVESYFKKEKLPKLSIGDTVKIGVAITEGNKDRLQYFEGVIIAKRNSGINETIRVRKVFQGIGVERIFLVNSPKINSFEVKKRAKVRRSKLYFLRGRSGKATRLKQRF
uniref:50S ribosomal protein L19, chloroplastic n=1 Tax=Olisthodiscus luteus TaxID=83000 RepID=A0A7U0KSY1_OLILU|nr:ribosomal protein L19 [Olisthodiscus luteus]QQW50608.1 ribosomal protein L19 [Olisthodiscus luteus]